MTNPGHASNVCLACASHKKRCDRALPACGTCVARRRACNYDAAADLPRDLGGRRYNPGKKFVALSTTAQNQSSQHPGVASNGGQGDANNEADQRWLVPPNAHAVDESLYGVFHHFTKLNKLTEDLILDRYSRIVHRWLPVLSPSAFHEQVSGYRTEGRLPPADLTVLILALQLIILPTLPISSRPPHSIQELLYNATADAFSQAQVSTTASLRLVQAALLIALREYTCVRPEAAYVSVLTCIGLARIVGLECALGTSSRQAPSEHDSRRERDDLSWSIAMLERLILFELNHKVEPQTSVPRSDALVPSIRGPSMLRQLDVNPEAKSPSLKLDALSCTDAAEAGQRQWRAESLSHVDRLLRILRVSSLDSETKLTQLMELDVEVRTLLESVFSKPEWKLVSHCCFVSFAERLMFLLHGAVFEILPHPQDDTERRKKEKSASALDMVSRMVAEAFDENSEVPGQVEMPMCCFYNMRTAQRRFQERNKLLMDVDLSRNIERLRQAGSMYYETWVF